MLIWGSNWVIVSRMIDFKKKVSGDAALGEFGASNLIKS